MTELHTDVAVIGVGAMGSATLWRLAERDVPAIGFERFQPGHDRGSSHGESRIYRTAYLEGPGYVPLARSSLGLWQELERVTRKPLHMSIGALMLGERNSFVISKVMESIRAHDLPHQFLEEDELRERYPGHRVTPGEVGIFETEGGIVLPEAAILAMVGRAEDLGARVLRECTVDRIEITPDGVRVTAGDVTCRAHHAVISVGAWLGKLMPELGLPLRITRQLPGWYPVENPEVFAPARFPVFMRDIRDYSKPGDITATDSTFYGFPSLDGTTIKVSIHREGPLTDPDRLDRTVHPEELQEVKKYIRLFLNGVSTEPVRMQVCTYTNTPDHDFLVGSPPGMPQITVLGGFSGHGFKFASVMGDVAADLATRGGTEHPVEFLSLDRFLVRQPL